MPTIEKVAVIGLDCAEPSLIFDRWINDLPNIRRLVKTGLHGQLESCMPPITVPAWSCMTTSKDPGTLGCYGFRNRKDHSYDGLSIATNLIVREPRVWDILGAAGKKSIAIGVPQTFPITRPMPGWQVTCFLTPTLESGYTSPPELADEIQQLVGEYLVDVKGFRTDDKQWLLGQIYEMTDKRFKVCKRLLETRPWDLFWMVEMGVDRIHHGYWQYMDPQHHRYHPGNPFEHAIHDYYVHIDRWIGELLGVMDLQKTAVWVVSDHGAKRMDGGFCFNDWLIREGLLVMKTPVTRPSKFKFEDVDWSRTRCWGEGGYYGRLFINLRGREPTGTVSTADYEGLRNELTAKLEALEDDQGRPMGTRAYKPEQIYRKVNGVPPDLIVIFGDLHWRSVGTVGNPSVYTFENDTGPDDANHAQQGMYIVSHPSIRPQRRDASLYDVTPTILRQMGQAVPGDMAGRPLT
ncbi:MAG: alkaline phosphatase family protein [Phycisphaerae bacterium]|nr:alkaline phosphatase family protein [Phycisphaerae bacterium]MCZ2400891.1 alkaline phosphatase family protein [Phycisphaerae bacterium]NUQ48804.1 alkaline phosphatase family protein [Phycisphaerae bacterium]